MYAIGFERKEYKKVLTFKLSRMKHTQLIEESYEIPKDFDPKQYLSGAWGIMGAADNKSVTVKLRFTKAAAPRIREGGYPNLVITQDNKDTDDSVEVEVLAGADYAGFPKEIFPWIQSWGPRVEVLSPANLRQRWLEEACAVAMQHPQLSSILATQNDATKGDTGHESNLGGNQMPQPLSKQAMSLWAKSTKDEKGYSLIGHLLDVAAVANALIDLEPPSTLRLYQKDFGLESEDVTRKWLAVFAGLHDIGKASPVFQQSWTPGSVLVKASGLNFAINKRDKYPKHGAISQKLLKTLLKDYGFKRSLANGLADAVGCHHGERFDNISTIASSDCGDEAWQKVQEELFDALLKAVDIVDEPRSSNLSGEAMIRLSGFTSFVDWIGSSQDFFPTDRVVSNLTEHYKDSRIKAKRALREIGWLRREALQDSPDSFKSFFNFEKTRPLQDVMAELALEADTPSLFIVEAPMGEGKTEAAFYSHLQLQAKFEHRGMYIALPTQATGNAMFERTKEFLDKAKGDDVKVDLQLLHGASLLNDSYANMVIKEINSEDKVYDIEASVQASEWFTNKKRALLSEYGVGTVDQALLSVLPTKHHFVRLWGLANRTVVIDEVHAYDMYTGTLIEDLVRWLHSLGSSLILMSATLASSQRKALLKAYGASPDELASLANYPSVTRVSSTGEVVSKTFEVRSQAPIDLLGLSQSVELIAEKLLVEVNEGGCAVCIVNTVDRAQKLFQILQDNASEDIELHIFHARYPAMQRKELEETVLAKFGKDTLKESFTVQRPAKAILVATQVVEQSLDLDFDVMVTDLAPIDLLLQRAGRLHRHERERPVQHSTPKLYVCGLGQELPDLATDYHDKIYDAYILLCSWHLLKDRAQIKLPDDFEPFIEYVYSGQVADDIEAEHQETFSRTLTEHQDNRQKERSIANRILIASPELYPRTIPNLTVEDDDDPSRAISRRAQTRLGEETLTVIPLYVSEDRYYLDANFETEINLDEKPDWDTAKRLFLQHLKISRKGVVKALQGKPIDKWKESSLLRHCRVLELRDGKAVFGKTVVVLNEVLGLIFSSDTN